MACSGIGTVLFSPEPSGGRELPKKGNLIFFPQWQNLWLFFLMAHLLLQQVFLSKAVTAATSEGRCFSAFPRGEGTVNFPIIRTFAFGLIEAPTFVSGHAAQEAWWEIEAVRLLFRAKRVLHLHVKQLYILKRHLTLLKMAQILTRTPFPYTHSSGHVCEFEVISVAVLIY